MGIWLGLDVGGVRTGIAESDPSHQMAFPSCTQATATLLPYLERHYQPADLAGIAVGLPVNLKGQETDGSQHARKVAEALRSLWPNVPLHFTDERFTSKLAAQAAHASGASQRVKKDKGKLDAAAAAILLDSFLTQLHSK